MSNKKISPVNTYTIIYSMAIRQGLKLAPDYDSRPLISSKRTTSPTELARMINNECVLGEYDDLHYSRILYEWRIANFKLSRMTKSREWSDAS